MENNLNLTVRSMSGSEIDIAVKWAMLEGWNPGLKDAQCFFQTDPAGFFVAESDGEPVGVVSAVAYDDTFGFAGFYIVKKELRKQGIGHALLERVFDYMGNRSIGLDGVVEQQENYKKIGARLAYRNIRFQLDGITGEVDETGLVPISAVPFAQIVEYDNRCFPAPRENFLKLWLAMPGAFPLAGVDNGRLTGFGMIRPCHLGWKIGPIFADDTDVAQRLLRALAAKADAGPIFFDVPEVNPDAVALAKKYDMRMVFETARMYIGPEPKVDLQRVFGVTTFELG